ncbi:MAG TPA: cytochrome c5 family protein, partial [Myxococcota bacterium]|nr:cytochrome c5 family protein [Myxococcota bacterium]
MRATIVSLLLASGSAWAEPADPAAADPAVRCAAVATWDKAACAGQAEAARKTFEAAKTQLAALPDCAALAEAER